MDLSIMLAPAPAGSARRLSRRAVAAAVGMLAMSTARADAQKCTRVEVFPGYPMYRGYITGVNGAGDIVCAEELAAAGFSRSDMIATLADAGASLGISGYLSDWTWENWMAVEAASGLPVTCFPCLMPPNQLPREPVNPLIHVYDPRLAFGEPDDTAKVLAIAADHGIDLAAMKRRFPSNQHLRAFAQLAVDGQGYLNAPELAAVYDLIGEILASGSQTLPGYDELWPIALARGGYAPTPASAPIDVQRYMMDWALEVSTWSVSPVFEEGIWNNYRLNVDAWMAERWQGSEVSLGEWLSGG